MPDLAPEMISMAYDHAAKRFISLCEMSRFRFCRVFRLVDAQNEMARNRRRLGTATVGIG
jgi:hypothetical protein